MENVLQILSEANLRIGIEKCHFGETEINFLGFTISHNKIVPNKKKCESISDLALPETYRDLHGFLGAIGFYRKHIPHLAAKEVVLCELLKTAPHKNAPLDMNDEQVLVFEQLKLELLNVTTQSFIDPASNNFTITTDASKIAIGAALHQVIDGDHRLIQFYSRKLKDVETRYSTFDRELLGAHDALQFFLPFVEGQNITMFTDHRPLTFALTKKSEAKSDRQARQLAFLSEHVGQMLYIKGEDNVVADFLSRPSGVNSVQFESFELDSLKVQQDNDEEVQAWLKDETKNVKIFKHNNRDLICEMSFDYATICEKSRFQSNAFHRTSRWQGYDCIS